MATGIKIFPSLEEAQAAGFTLYEKRPDGFLVRRDDGHSFALALVVTEPAENAAEDTPPEE
jgi:hypothetical protein